MAVMREERKGRGRVMGNVFIYTRETTVCAILRMYDDGIVRRRYEPGPASVRRLRRLQGRVAVLEEQSPPGAGGDDG